MISKTFLFAYFSIGEYTIGLQPLSSGNIVGMFVIVLLLCMSALMSGSEVAFFSLTPAQLQLLSQRKSRANNLILLYLKKPQQLLATLLVANNLVNIGIVIISTFIITSVFDFSQAWLIGFLFQVVIVTFLLLLFGEIMPKIFASRQPIGFAQAVALPLYVVDKLLRPFSALLMLSSGLVSQRVIQKQLSLEEISKALDLTPEVASEEKEILEGIVKLKSTEVKNIMRSRIDVVAMELNSSFEQLRDLVINSGYSRIPIFEKTFDNIKGILYVKDLLPHLQKPNNFRWQTLVRPPYFVPEAKKIDSLLEEFQRRHIHLAVVIDEYGGARGIVTMEDILEEIVGEINDEFDEEKFDFVKVNEKTFIFDGKFLLNDIPKVTEIDEHYFDDVKGDAETLAGLVLEIKGEFPRLYEEIRIKSLLFRIEAENARRIQKIKVTLE